MPPSPPPPAQAIIQVDPDSASLDHLLDVLDAARAHATAPLAGEPGPEPSSPPPPTRRRRRRPDDSPPLASHLDDLAADTLAQRHAARRQRELEWDERDNLDRATRALLSSLTAGDDGPGLESSDDGEPALDRLSAAERFFNMAADLVQAGADDNDVRHHVESDHGPSSDDDDHDGWVDAGHVDDFHLGGFDGDMFDLPDDDESGDDDVHFGDAWAQPRPAATSPSADFGSMLPGFAGERPLNPPHVAPSDVYSAPSPDPVVPYLSRDPSSALSYSSFLQPGATFVGEQTFGVRSRARAQHGPSMSLDGAPRVCATAVKRRHRAAAPRHVVVRHAAQAAAVARCSSAVGRGLGRSVDFVGNRRRRRCGRGCAGESGGEHEQRSPRRDGPAPRHPPRALVALVALRAILGIIVDLAARPGPDAARRRRRRVLLLDFAFHRSRFRPRAPLAQRRRARPRPCRAERQSVSAHEPQQLGRGRRGAAPAGGRARAREGGRVRARPGQGPWRTRGRIVERQGALGPSLFVAEPDSPS